MQIKQREIYTSRYYRHGNAYGCIIPPDIRQLMGLVPGDTLAMNFQHGVLWMVRLTGNMIINRETVSKVFDELFADKRGAHANE